MDVPPPLTSIFMAEDNEDKLPRSRLTISTSSFPSKPSVKSTAGRSRLVLTVPEDQPIAVRKRLPSSRFDFGNTQVHQGSQKRPKASSASTLKACAAPVSVGSQEDVRGATVAAPGVVESSTPTAAQLALEDTAAQAWQSQQQLSRVEAEPTYLHNPSGTQPFSGPVELYWAALVADEQARFRLDSSLFVLQNWDEQEEMLQVRICVAIQCRIHSHMYILARFICTCYRASTRSRGLRNCMYVPSVEITAYLPPCFDYGRASPRYACPSNPRR